MRAKDIIPAEKPRNFVAKNAMKTTSGAGQHTDKKQADKQGNVKHKGKEYAEGMAEAQLDELIGMNQGPVKRDIPQRKKPTFAELAKQSTDKRSALQRQKDGGKKNWFAEETGDKPFDNMMKKVTKTPTAKARNTERIRQKREREEETRDRLKGGFGLSPADKLSIREPKESSSGAMANAASRLVNKDDGKVAKLRAAGDKRREDQLKSRNIAKKNEDAASVAESDPSGLMHAARHLNKEFRITAEVDGVAKRARVQAQSSRTAQEKFMKRYPTAQIHNVEDITQQMSETGVAEGGFFDPDRPNIGDVVKHKHSGAMGRIKKIGTQGDTTTVYFKDAKTGAMNYGEWKKHVFPIKKQGVAEGGGGGVRQWANQVRKDHGADVKFRNRQEGSGAVDSIIAKNSQGDTVGVFNRKTNHPTVFEPKTGVAEGSAQNTPQQAKVRAAIVAGMKSSDEFNAAKVAAAGVARDKSVAINGPAGQYKYIPLRRQGGFASNSIDSIDRIEPDGTVVMNLVGNATHPDIRWIKTLLAQGGIPGAEVVNYYPDITATDEVVRQIIGNVGAGLGRNEFMNQLQIFLNVKYDGQQVKGAMRNADLLWAKYTDLKQGVAEGSFGSGYGRVFTLYVNTGEKPPTKTKTKKFKREDDAVAWAEDYADTHDQYPTLQMEIKDDNGGVVWELEESQGVAEVSNTTLRSYSKKAEKELATPGAPVKQNRVDGVVRAANKRYAKDSEEVYGKVKESLRRGEYYVHTVHFADGETGQIKTHNDEQTDDSIKAFYAKQGKDVVKVDYNWGIQGEQDY